MIIARETAALSVADRAAVDREIAADPDALVTRGDRELAGSVAGMAARLDPASVVARRRKAEADRRVTLRPAPDTMTHLSALLPVAEGVAVYAALTAAADSARSTGDPRSKGQLMADTLVHQLTARTDPAAGTTGPGDPDSSVGIMLNVIITDQQLFGGVDGAGVVAGHGPVDAELVRELAVRDRVWLRRCFTDPDSGVLTATESRARRYPRGLRTLIQLRDLTCRTPWCDAPIRHTDHGQPHIDGGPTSLGNGQGLCEACNHAKQAPGWKARLDAQLRTAALEDRQRRTGRVSDPPPVGARDTILVTPTGHRYRTRAPVHPGALRRPREIYLGGISPSRIPVEIQFRDTA